MADLKFRSSALTHYFPLVKDLVTLPYAPTLGQSARPGAAEYLHFPPTEDDAVAFEDGSMGLGLFSAPNLLERRYNFTSGVDKRFKDKGLLWGKFNVTGLAPTPDTLGLNGSFRGWALWQDNVMVIAGRAIYKLNQSTVQWELWDDSHPAITAWAMVVHENKLIVQWDGEGHYSIFTDPANNATVTTNAVLGVMANRLGVVGSSIYANTTWNKFYFNDDPTEATLANWTTFVAGDLSYDVKAIWAAGGYLQIGKKDGLYNFGSQNTDGKADVAVPLKEYPSSFNFQHRAFLGDWVWASVGTGDAGTNSGRNLIAYNLVTGEVQRKGLHPRDIAPNTPEVGGAVYGMCNSEDRTRLYMVVKNESSPLTGRAYLLIEVGENEGQLVYHTIGGYDIACTEIILVHTATINAPTLWWFIDASPWKPAYMRFARNGSSPDGDSTYLFDTGTTNYEYTPWITGNFVDLTDGWYYLKAQTEQCSATATIRLDYQLDTGTDGGTWTTLETFTANGWSSQVNWPYNTSCKRFRFRIRYYSASSSTTPILRKIVMHGRLLPPGLRLVQGVIKCERAGVDTVKSQRDAFYSHVNQNGLIEITIGDDFPLIFLGTIPKNSITEIVKMSSTEPAVEIQFALLEAQGASPT